MLNGEGGQQDVDSLILEVGRDAAGGGEGSGMCLAVVLALGSPHLLGWFRLAATFMAVCDGVIVLSSGGPKSVAYSVHEATAAVMIVGAILLLLS